MERAKRIATAFIGVAFAANCCDPVVAQTSNRFIRQPAKAPATPAPATPAPATPAPATTTSAPATPAPATPAPATPAPATPAPASIPAGPVAAAADTESQGSSNPLSSTIAPALSTVNNIAPANSAPTNAASPVVNGTASLSATPNPGTTGQITLQTSTGDKAAIKELALSSETAKPTLQDVKKEDVKPQADFSFPSLLSLSNSPDVIFDSLEPFPTVPDLVLEKSEKPSLNLAAPASDSRTENAHETLQPQTNAALPATTRSGQLQWTKRTNMSSGRSDANHSSDKSSSGSPSQYGSTTLQNSSFKARTNTSPSTDTPWRADQASTAVKQQSDSNEQRQENVVTNKVEELAQQQRVRAELVSARITNDPRFTTQSHSQVSVTRIESPQGWQAIGARLSSHVAKCESLLRRGAFCSAREEAEAASMLLYRHIDLHDNLFRCEPAVQSANQALREAEDFLVALRSTSDGESIRRLVDAHETPVLKDKNLTGMSPLTAAQHYRHFAESRLVEAAQGHPWASELLYTVGRTYQAEADAESNRVDALRMKAMAYYQASRTTLPSNAITCNQLGYLLLQMDRNTEAREALVAAVTLKQEEAFLSNLAEASRRLGDSQTVAWATQSVAAIRRRTPPPSPVPPYVEVSQEDFIAISPREIGPKTSHNSGSVPAKPADRTASVPNTNQLR